MRLHVIEQTTERSTFAHGRPKMRAFEKAPVRIVSAQAYALSSLTSHRGP